MSSVTRFAGSGTHDQNGGKEAFYDHSYITADDSNYAYASNIEARTYRLIAYNFGFTIPSGSTINGITGIVNLSGIGSWYGAWVRKADASFGETNKKSSGLLPTSFTDVSIGGSNDLWGLSWSAEDINDSDFGLGVQFIGGDQDPPYGQIRVNYIKITIDYTVNSSIKTLNGLAKASVKVVNGLAIASIKGIDGLT